MEDGDALGEHESVRRDRAPPPAQGPFSDSKYHLKNSHHEGTMNQKPSLIILIVAFPTNSLSLI